MPLMDDSEEVLDLVDKSDQKISTILREDVLKIMDGTAGFVRAADGFVVNSNGEVWVPRRMAHKKIAPNGLDFSAGEHVGAGESYEAAMVRGFKEELGLHLVPEDLEYVGKLSPQPGVPYFESVFVYRADEVPHYSREDFASWEWLKPEVLRERLLAGETAKKGLLPALDLLIAYNNKEGINQEHGH
jgi:8-oxo-dGTP pyrophosphatase MutT (NUDIX family)